MPMNLNICFTDAEIEHDSTGLQDPLQCVGAQSCHWAIGQHGISQCIIDLSPNLRGTMLEPMRQPE